MIPTDPLIAQLALPIVVVIVATALIRIAGGPGMGARLAAASLPIAVVVSVAVFAGLAITPPVTALEKLVWLALGGCLLGMLIEFGAGTRLIVGIIGFFWPALAIVWVGGIDVTTAGEPVLYRIGEIGVVAGLAMTRLHQIADGDLDAPITGAVIAAGLAGLALVAGPAYGTAIGWPLAAAGVGWLICNWPGKRLPFGSPGDLGANGLVIALAAVLVHDAGVNAILVLLVLSALIAQPIARRIVAGSALTRSEAVRPIALAALVAVPPVVAILLALFAPAAVPRIY